MFSIVQIMLSTVGLFFCTNLIFCSQSIQPLCLDFDASMHRGFTPEIYAKLLRCKPQGNSLPILKKLFNENISLLQQKAPSAPHHPIPHIIHQIWLGSPLPERYKAFQASWIKMHPTWEYKLWTDSDVEVFGLKNITAFNLARNYAEKANIFRYEILERFGGLYVDTDFECLRALDLVHDTYEFYAGLATVAQATLINNALIGTIPHHPIIKACVDNITTNLTNLGQMQLNGTIYFGRIFLKTCAKDINMNMQRVIVFPPTYFYPWPGDYMVMPDTKEPNYTLANFVTAESFAVHYWDRTWWTPSLIPNPIN